MFKLTKLIHFAPDATPSDREPIVEILNAAATGSPLVARSLLRPTLPGVYNGGDYIWHLQFADDRACRAWAGGAQGAGALALLGDNATIAHVDSVSYQGGRAGSKKPALTRGVYRTLLLSIDAASSETAMAQFEAETFAMGEYIPTIRSWQVSRVSEASGARPWTHVWEQEYADLSGLQGAYMMHPYHWGYIDRWFDPECVDRMIDTVLCHTFCAFEGGMIAPEG